MATSKIKDLNEITTDSVNTSNNGTVAITRVGKLVQLNISASTIAGSWATWATGVPPAKTTCEWMLPTDAGHYSVQVTSSGKIITLPRANGAAGQAARWTLVYIAK